MDGSFADRRIDYQEIFGASPDPVANLPAADDEDLALNSKV